MDLHKLLAATARNRTHDVFRALPVEIKAMCWSYLPFHDVCRLALVCKHWRDASNGCPRLWNNMTRLDHVPSNTRLLIARCGTLKIRFSISVRTYADYTRLPQCLRVLAPRLYDLSVVIEFSPVETRSGMDVISENLFAYPAPMLNSFQLVYVSRCPYFLRLREDVFSEFAPNLRTVCLRGVELPDRCAAMQTVHSVRIGSGLWNRKALFAVFPSVERLRISKLADWAERFPPVPAGSRLQEFMVTDDESDRLEVHLGLRHMMKVGYFNVPRITLHSIWGDLLVFALAHPDRFPNQTLTINGAGRTELRVGSEHDDTSATACAEEVDFWNLRLFLQREKYTSQIQHLAIPLYFPSRIPLVSGVIEIPQLLTLAITCGGLAPEGHKSLLDSDSGFGLLYAPLLKRLEIRREPGYTGEIQPIDPVYLQDFIDMCLLVERTPALDRRPGEHSHGTDSEDSGLSRSELSEDSASIDSSRSLELRIDTANGVRFLGRTTLPRYLLPRNNLGYVRMRRRQIMLVLS